MNSAKWVGRWAGSYTFISCSYWGRQYYYALKKILGQAFTHTLFIHHRGTVSFYAPQNELARLGRALAARVTRNPKLARDFCNQLKRNTDVISAVMKKLRGQILESFCPILTMPGFTPRKPTAIRSDFGAVP